MSGGIDTAQVHADAEWLDGPQRMGWLRCQHGGRGEVFSFEYEPDWLASPRPFVFDPELALVAGPQYPPADRTNFGIFLDSAPKASVRDEHGLLCIAKFPSRQDTHDAAGWELVAHRLATKAGIRVPPSRPLRLGDNPYTTFLVQRFDRTPQGRRHAFVSAMTLIQRRDGEPGASYLELVDLLQSRGADTRADCEELFRRVVFSILIHNTDDHLRNHGFLLMPQGVRLSPAYDINPVPDQHELTLAINEADTHCDVDIAMQTRGDYGLSAAQAQRVLQQVREAVAGWRHEAMALKIPKAEQERMAAAFAN